jgi:hypothetical protein
MTFKVIASVSAILTLGVSAALAAPNHQLDRAQDAFDLDLPSGCKIAGNPSKLDFELFIVTCGGVPYAGIYAGNAPQTDIPRSRLLRTGYEWPALIQVWSLKVTHDQGRANKIAASVRLRSSSVR